MPILKSYFLPIFLFFIGSLSAQDFSSVDATVKAYPVFAKPEMLAAQISHDFASEDEKARAIFTWIATNVKYDMQQYFAGTTVREVAYSYRTPAEKAQKEKQFTDQIVNQTWRSKKAVCHGYSELYNHLAKLVGLESILVPGTSKSHPTHIGKLPMAADHAWNAVKTNAKWHLVDVTWAAGGVDGNTKKFLPKFNDSYFFTSPEIFFLNHFPDDQRLLMIDKSPEEFASLPLYYGEYLNSDYTIVAPNSGVIKPVSASIPFRINNFDGSRISYVFSSDNTFHNVMPRKSGSSIEFNVPVGKTDYGFLTLYIDSASVVTYKIQRG